jgi:hypothetical protein
MISFDGDDDFSRTSIAASSFLCSAIENKLDGQINVIAQRLASNLDTISERRQRAMRPAAKRRGVTHVS